jgi:hypothetical protein
MRKPLHIHFLVMAQLLPILGDVDSGRHPLPPRDASAQFRQEETCGQA